MNIFPVSTDDISVFYLGQLFGLVGNLWAPSTTNEFPFLPHVLFQSINTLALVLGTLLVVYVTVIGVLATAHEGEFMGKKWSGMWIPIRMVMGIVGLFPTSSGYSAIQIIIMWIIMQGIGAANNLWGVAITYLKSAGSAYGGIQVDTISVSNNMRQLFQNLVCQQTLKKNYSNTYTTTNPDGTTKDVKSYYYCNVNTWDNCSPVNYTQNSGQGLCSQMQNCFYTDNPTNPGASYNSNNPGDSRSFRKTVYDFGTGSKNCGQVVFPNPDYYCDAPQTQDTKGKLQCEAVKGLRSGLDSVIITMNQIAEQFVNADHDYMDFYYMIPNVDYKFGSASNNFSVKWDPVPQQWLQDFCKNGLKLDMNQCCRRYYNLSVIDNISQSVTYKTTPDNCPSASSFPSPDGQGPQQNSIQDVNKDVITSAFPYYTLNNISMLSNKNDFISAVTGQYIFSISNAITNFLINNSDEIKTTGDDRLANAAKQGWITAGANYYQLTKSGSNNLKEIMDALQISITVADRDNLQPYRNNILAATILMNSAQQENGDSGGIAAKAPEFAAVTESLKGSLIDTFIKNLTHGATDTNVASQSMNQWHTNLLSSIATYGQNLMITAQVLYAVTLVIGTTLAAVSSINFMGLGTGIPGDQPLYAFFKALLFFIMPLFIALVGALFSLGALLGIYVPLIPYIIFTVGTIGWFIAVIEAMVAGPFIALGILSPAGQHELLGKAEASVLLLLNLFLRPALMIMGLLLAIYLSDVVLNLINAGFLTVIGDSFQQGMAPGLFEQLIIIGAYTSLILIAINKAFSIIYELPNRVLTWIGGQAVSYGEAEALGQVQRGVEGAASGAAGAARSAGGAAMKAGTKQQSKEQKDAEEAERNKKLAAEINKDKKT